MKNGIEYTSEKINYTTTSDSAVGVGIYTHRNGIPPKLHKHDFYEILYIVSGDFKHVVNEREYFISQGDCSIIIPDDWHFFEYAQGSGKCCNRDILIEKALFEEICALVPSTLHCIQASHGAPMAKFSIQEVLELEKLLAEFSENENLSAKRWLGISAILKIFSKIFEKQNEREKPVKNNEYPLNIQSILDRFNKTSFLQQGISSIIQDTGYSQSYICRIFKIHVGMSMSDYLKHIRLTHIAYYLKTTNHSLREIGDLVGIESLSYLNKIFKETYGTTPIKYRKTHAVSQKRI